MSVIPVDFCGLLRLSSLRTNEVSEFLKFVKKISYTRTKKSSAGPPRPDPARPGQSDVRQAISRSQIISLDSYAMQIVGT